MKTTNSSINVKHICLYEYLAKIKKLACGRSVMIPNYGKVTAYRDYRGKRRYSLSGSTLAPNGGNLSIMHLEFDMLCNPTFFDVY